MALVSNATTRRFRFLHVQLFLACVAFLSYAIVTFIYRRATAEKAIWELRMEELKKYDSPEVDLTYVRYIGQTYRRITDLTEQQIDRMNSTELLVSINSFLDNADVICKRKLRIGYVSEGGWEVCDDELVRPSSSSCLVYSFNVRSQYDFQDDMSRVYRCEVHSFNPNLSGKDFNRSDRVTVHPYGIGRSSYLGPDGREFYSLPDIGAILGHLHHNPDLVQMSLEGGEWPALFSFDNLNALKNVKQLLIEFHVGYPPTTDRHRRSLRVLRSLYQLGFRKFYVHKKAKGAYFHPSFPVMQPKHYEVHYINGRLS